MFHQQPGIVRGQFIHRALIINVHALLPVAFPAFQRHLAAQLPHRQIPELPVGLRRQRLQTVGKLMPQQKPYRVRVVLLNQDFRTVNIRVRPVLQLVYEPHPHAQPLHSLVEHIVLPALHGLVHIIVQHQPGLVPGHRREPRRPFLPGQRCLGVFSPGPVRGLHPVTGQPIHRGHLFPGQALLICLGKRRVSLHFAFSVKHGILHRRVHRKLPLWPKHPPLLIAQHTLAFLRGLGYTVISKGCGWS